MKDRPKDLIQGKSGKLTDLSEEGLMGPNILMEDAEVALEEEVDAKASNHPTENQTVSELELPA